MQPELKNESDSPAFNEVETVSTLQTLLGETIAPSIRQARATFQRDLPVLLRDHRGRWVAYSGSQRVLIGPSKTQVYQECQRRGLVPGEFLVLSIEPTFAKDVELPVNL